MAEEPAKVLQVTQTVVQRATDFELNYANYFRLRLGAGECTITFATITDAPTSAVAANTAPQLVNVLQENMAVAMPWPVIKTLARHLNEMVEAIEQEMGPIRGMKSIVSPEQAIAQYRKVLAQTLPQS